MDSAGVLTDGTATSPCCAASGSWSGFWVSMPRRHRACPQWNPIFANLSSNLSAILLFAFKGHVWWHLALPLALANVVGSLVGTRLALKHGAGFVRGVFIVVVLALILKTGYDAFMRA
ncbi:sulfite exporter TauE/SafE family protein [Mycobacterium tuberculosis]|uniref:sulfite exporter TauE/SafE family protein n=1 Tax=Mycobacterium tuberculosis TaxID=1773 RepID=UPI00272C2EA5|nr:sulfite exporter TauE/SafE family protein [Mycobacterium tuberculosis]